MVAAPAFGIVFMFMAVGGLGMPSDLLSAIEPDAYFRSRQVSVTVAKMLELAGTQPSEAKGEVARLLAIRMLGEEPDEVQKEKQAIVKVLQPLAEGKGPGDKHSFVRRYARRTLDRIGVKGTSPERAASEQSSQKLVEAFSWFPDKVAFVVGSWNVNRDDARQNPLSSFLKANVPPEAFEQVYKFAETVGNVRLDGFAFGFAVDAQQPGKGSLYVRITGAADHERLVDFLRKNGGLTGTVKEEKGPQGERITFLAPQFGPAMALVGDTDLIIGGREGPGAADTSVLEQMLKIRAGTQPNITKGPLGEALKKVAPQTVGLILGDVPAEARQGLLAGGPLRAFPDRVQVEVSRAAKGDLEVSIHAKMLNANEAKLFAEDGNGLRKKGLEALKNPPPTPPGIKLPPRTFEMMRETLESVKLEPKENMVTGGMQVPRELLTVLPMAFFASARVEAPMPQQKNTPAPGK
jgi:hypothetical protein